LANKTVELTACSQPVYRKGRADSAPISAAAHFHVIQLIWSVGIESMTVTNPFRYLYIKTTDLTHGYQDNRSQLSVFYRLWAPLYDFSVSIDPAYKRNLFQMVKLVVQNRDAVLDVGCGTGLATIAAAVNAQSVVALDPSQEMLSQLQKKLKHKHVSNVEIIHGYQWNTGPWNTGSGHSN
jgi:2-polyprenyl-3-methyl-5-hydroxy-6-metoxy-1,4-benzoquinol methylase